MARLRAARTVHGAYSAATRARNRYDLTALRRGLVGNAAVRCLDRLPPDLAARLMRMAPELMPPPCPSGGLTPAEDRAVLRAEADALAPWRAAIAQGGRDGRARAGRPPLLAGPAHRQKPIHQCCSTATPRRRGMRRTACSRMVRQNPLHQSALATRAAPPWLHHPPLRWQRRQKPMHQNVLPLRLRHPPLR
jgi:hypothetical protein